MEQEPEGLRHLSERERDVAALLMQGMSNKQIAITLNVTIRTVEFHLSNIYSKLGVGSRTEAVLTLTGIRLRESTGVTESDKSGESTVEMGSKPAKNGGHLILRRVPVKKWAYIIIPGGLLSIALVVALVFARTPDFHSDEEISQVAMKSAYDNFDSTEMKIDAGDQYQIGEVVLNQFLKKFRQRETHYGIRLVSYEILEIDFIEETHDQLHYAARVKVRPQDKAVFVKIIDDVFPYEENDNEELLFSFGFVVHQQGETYKLVDIGELAPD